MGENTRESINGLPVKSDFVSYVTASAYGVVETLRAMKFSGELSLLVGSTEDIPVRATEGFAGMLDQNTGDGAIMALGFIGAEVVTGSFNVISKKLGGRVIDPNIRFVASVAFGIGIASYLETTKAMSNSIDIPNDLFGIGLAAALILGTKVLSRQLSEVRVETALSKVSLAYKALPDKLSMFNRSLVMKISGANELNKQEVIEEIANDFLSVVGVEDNVQNL